MGHAERKTVPDAMYVPEVQIGANQVCFREISRVYYILNIY